jgi:DNA-binding CsgD family transcriptional regulator
MGTGTSAQERATFSNARALLLDGCFEATLRMCGELVARNRAETIEVELLRARALIPLGRADRALDVIRRLQIVEEVSDENLTARMLQGAALVRLSQLDQGLAILSAAYRASFRAHPTVRAELVVNLGIAHYRKRNYGEALRLLESVPDDSDIIRVRATVFEAWVALDRSDVAKATERFEAALRRITSCRNYDRFVEASALYGLTFLCSEVPRLDLWPAVRDRIERFDWSAGGVAMPRFWIAMMASYVTEMRGEFDAASEWMLRAEAAAETQPYEVLALVRLAEYASRYGELRSKVYFLRKAQAYYERLPELLRSDDHALPLAMAEEVVSNGNADEATSLLTYYSEVIAPRVAGTKDERTLEATRSMVQGLVEDAAGRKSSAASSYAAALEAFTALGFGRRAAIAAYRLAVLTGGEEQRQFASGVLKDADSSYWLKHSLANFRVAEIRLTDRQAEVLRLLVEGKSNKEIAAVRGGSWYTARNIVRELLDLFGVRSRSELVRVAIARGVVARRRTSG